jgi:hypothetical protein
MERAWRLRAAPWITARISCGLTMGLRRIMGLGGALAGPRTHTLRAIAAAQIGSTSAIFPISDSFQTVEHQHLMR